MGSYPIADRERDTEASERQRSEAADRIRARLQENREKLRVASDFNPYGWEVRGLAAQVVHDSSLLAQLEPRRSIQNDPHGNWKPHSGHVFEPAPARTGGEVVVVLDDE